MFVNRKGVTWAVVVATVLVALSVVFPSLAVEAVYPVEKAKRGFVNRIWTRVTALWSASEAKAENVRLKREIAALSLANGECARLQAENARLREALGYSKGLGDRWLPAPVLSNGAAAVVKKLIWVGKGSLAGVKEDAIAVVPEGIVGRVVKVTLHESEILLLTDAECKVSSYIELGGGRRAHGIVSGGTSGALAMNFMTPGVEPPVSARIVTSGLGGIFPAGFEVGRVIDSASIEPSVDFSSLEDVFILTGGE